MVICAKCKALHIDCYDNMYCGLEYSLVHSKKADRTTDKYIPLVYPLEPCPYPRTDVALAHAKINPHIPIDINIALNYTIRLYKWLEKNINKQCKDWPGWRKNGGNVATCYAESPLCEYTGRRPEMLGCRICPLTEYWQNINKGKGFEHIVHTCKSSPCEKYSDSLKPKYARRIWQAAERKLKKLKGSQ